MFLADDDSSPHVLLDDQQNKSIDESKTSSTTPAGTISPSPHLYHRRASHILTTPPNPLASDNHPDNQLTVGNNFQKTFTPILSAGFELSTTKNNNKSNSTTRTSFFNFESKQTDFKHQHNENLVDNNHEDDQMTKPLMINSTKISSNNLIQDDSSNHSSTNSSCHNATSRIFSQMLQSSGNEIIYIYIKFNYENYFFFV